MPTIGVIGASGQVGTELCVFLGTFPDVRCIALCRTEQSTALLRRCGVECRVGDVGSPESARALLNDCDLVFDLSLPKGLVHEIRAATRRTIHGAVRGSRESAKFVFASTVMAFGHPYTPGAVLRRRLFAKTAYGGNKRAAERVAAREGRRAGRQVWVLRLAQVHGEMQSISRMLLRAVDGRPTYAPDVPSNTVFVFTIAEALVRIAEGRERPGLYTLVSTPQWSWREMHAHYAALRGVTPWIVEGPTVRPERATTLMRARRLITGRLLGVLARRRDFVNAYVLHHFPALEWSAKAAWLRRSAASQVARGAAEEIRDLTVLAGAFAGDAPGKRLRSLSDSRSTMEPHARIVRERLGGAVPPVDGVPPPR